MRGARSTLVLLLAFLALGAYVYFVELKRPPASDTPPNEQLVELEAEDVVRLSVEVDGGTTTLTRVGENEGWQITSPVRTAADDTQVSSMTSALASLEIRRVIDEAATELGPFGLVEPVVTLGFAAAGGGEEQRLLVGNTTPTGGERYAKLADSGRVFLIAPHLDTTFGKSTFDLRDKTILDFETSDVDRFEIARGDTRIGFSKVQNEWRVTDPWDVRADFSTVEGTVGRLNTGQMRAVETEGSVEADADELLAAYGLAAPQMTVTVGSGSATATLAVGDETAAGTFFAKDASRAVVFTIESTLVTDLERDPSEYRNKNLFEFRPFNALRVEVEQPGDLVAFEKAEATDESTETTWRKVAPEAVDVDRAGMDDLLAKLSNLRAESFVESREDLGLDDDTLLATVRVSFDAGTTGDDGAEQEQVTLWRTAETTYGVHGDEPGAALLETRSVDDALEALATVQAEES